MTLTTVETTHDTAQMLLERVQELLITCVDRINSERRLANHALLEAGLYELWVPTSVRGFEFDPVSYMEVTAKIC
jgi:hypothetical protein